MKFISVAPINRQAACEIYWPNTLKPFRRAGRLTGSLTIFATGDWLSCCSGPIAGIDVADELRAFAERHGVLKFVGSTYSADNDRIYPGIGRKGARGLLGRFAPQMPPAHGTVEKPGIQMRKPEMRGHRARNRALATGRRPVDGDREAHPCTMVVSAGFRRSALGRSSAIS